MSLWSPSAQAIVTAQDFRQNWQLIQTKTTLQQKLQRLDDTRRNLKTRFVGIDYQIDRFIDLVTTWYLLPEAQVRPLVINLWGMTGVGKTSLVRAVIEALDLKSVYSEVDIGELINRQHVYEQDNPHPLYRNAFMSGKPMVWLLDEFHTGRTVSEQGFDISRVGMRPIFKLLSDGIVPVPTAKDYLLRLAQQMHAEPGQNQYLNDNPLDDLNRFIYPKMTRDELRKEFTSKAGRRGLAAHMLAFIPGEMPLEKDVDYRRSIVIVAGNLDEAFQDVTVMDPLLMSAQEFHEASKLVTVRRVKDSLRRRYRAEQIARLGNTHIIYPSFSEGGFRQLIQMELDRLAKVAREETQLTVTFTPAVVDLLYAEGVIPSQGARPPLTTVTDVIGSRLTSWLIRAMVVEDPVSEVAVDVKDGSTLVIKGKHFKDVAFKMETPVPLIAGDRNRVDPSETQRRVAYREAAKAVVGMFAKNELPIAIYSKSADSTPGGSVRFANPVLPTKKDLSHTLQIMLASCEIEKMKFGGADGVSVANGSDIAQATELVGRMVQDWGMGGKHITQSSKLPCSTKFATDKTHEYLDGKIQNDLLCEATAEAHSILDRESVLVDALANHLTSEATIRREALVEMIKDKAIRGAAKEALLEAASCGGGLVTAGR